jgi:ribosomal protein S18 acetylase RimI-like enzyme
MTESELGLGWQSELLASRFGAQVLERDDCIVLRTPSNPTFYWGNCLILPTAPRDRDLTHWLQRFEQEIARDQPESRHLAFGVNASTLSHALPSWREAGIDEMDDTAVLVLEHAQWRCSPAPRVAGVVFRRLSWPQDFEQVLAAQVRSRDAQFEEQSYRLFRRRSLQRVVAMHDAGRAHWYGALVGEQLVADCGLVFSGDLARFQHVTTQAEWRRQGLCRALVSFVCDDAFGRLGVHRLLMCADPHDVAIGIYRSLGFAQVETHWSLQRHPKPE